MKLEPVALSSMAMPGQEPDVLRDRQIAPALVLSAVRPVRIGTIRKPWAKVSERCQMATWYWVDGRNVVNPYWAKLLQAKSRLFGRGTMGCRHRVHGTRHGPGRGDRQ